MSMLHELEYQFLSGIRGDDQNILDHINTKNRTASRQFSAYRDSILGGLLKVLDEIYPVSLKLVGKDFFHALCMRYIKQTPALSFDLNDYGDDLYHFTRQFSPANQLPYLPDVMQLEWAWHRAYQAPDIDAGNISALADLSPGQLEDAILILQPTGTVIESPYPVHLIWKVNQAEYLGDETVSLDTDSIALFVWRNGMDIHIDPVTASMCLLLKAIEARETLGALQTSKLPLLHENLTTLLQSGYAYQFHR